MKIAIIGHKHVPSREGGVEVAVGELAARAAKRNNDVALYNRREKCQPQPAEYSGAKILCVPTLKSGAAGAFLYSLFAAFKAAGQNYDVVHFHAEGPAAMLLLPKLRGTPTVVTIHGLDWRRAKWHGFARWYLRAGEKIAAKYADEIIVLSRGMQDYFEQSYGRKTHVVPNGVTPPAAARAKEITARFGLKKDGYLLYLGRLVPEKGVHYLIEAYRGLRTEKRLVIAGRLDGSAYAKRLRALSARDKRIILTDFVSGKVLDELLSNAFLYVLPSEVEGQSLSLLEAMSCGTRCLVSDISENVEAGAKYAATFKNKNVLHLRQKLDEILRGECEFLPQEQIEFVKRNHNWDDVVDKTLEIYAQAIKKHQKA